MSKYKHPVSGEPISVGEHVSWKIQFGIRRWAFIGTITLVTIGCAIWGTFDITVIGWWNVWASYMALFIESVVGMSMFSMAQNDGRIIRETHALLDRVEELIREIKEMATKDAQHSEMDYEVDLDSNQKLSEIIERLDEIEPFYGEWNGEV